MCFWNKVLSTFDGKDDMYVDLGVGVGHILPHMLYRCRPYGAKELGQTRFYTDAVATRLKRVLKSSRVPRRIRFGSGDRLYRCRPYGEPGFLLENAATQILKKYAETPKQYAEIPKQKHPKQINPTGFKRFLESSRFSRSIRCGSKPHLPGLGVRA